MTIPNRQSSLNEWVDWLLHLHAEEIDLGLDRIRQVANAMKITRPAPLVISVAGTNGKGSSVAMLVAILKASGCRVGAYTSPHIQTFNERIQIDGTPVGDATIVDAFEAIERARGACKLTYFEFSTLAALRIFKQSSLDVVVLEVGLGGRLDAVNVVDADAALITAIDIDHVDWLGDDRSVIATEKAGIMRPGKPSVCSDSHPPESLKTYAFEHDVPLSQFKTDFDIEVTDQAWSVRWREKMAAAPQLIDLPMPALKGAFQLQNAAGVLALLQRLTDRLAINRSAVVQGLQQARHPGRLESLTVGHQTWLVDVAHNPQSASALASYLQQVSPSSQGVNAGQYTAIFSVLSDKDARPMIEQLAPFIQRWVITDLAIPRATSLEELTRLLLLSGVAQEAIVMTPNMAEAVDYVKQSSMTDVLVWGSFFTVSQVYDVLSNSSLSDGVVCG